MGGYASMLLFLQSLLNTPKIYLFSYIIHNFLPAFIIMIVSTLYSNPVILLVRLIYFMIVYFLAKNTQYISN